MNLVEFFPYPFVVCLIILAVIAFLNRKHGLRFLLGFGIFGIYLMALLYVVFFPIPFPSDWPNNVSKEVTMRTLGQINLIPFNFGTIGGQRPSVLSLLRDIVLNILLTIPYGLGVCVIYRLNFKKILLNAAIVGIALEGIQLLIRIVTGLFYHSVDINDVLWNFSGVLLGAAIYRIGHRILNR